MGWWHRKLGAATRGRGGGQEGGWGVGTTGQCVGTRCHHNNTVTSTGDEVATGHWSPSEMGNWPLLIPMV